MDRVIQARLKEAGNSDTIHNYKDKMEQCPNPKMGFYMCHRKT